MERNDRTAYDRAIADVHTALGEDAFAAAWAAGQAMGLEEAIVEALQEDARPLAQPVDTSSVKPTLSPYGAASRSSAS